MSAETRPIPSSQFAIAIQDLPVENIYSKAYEIENSISHLEKSNLLLKQYSDNIKTDTSLQSDARDEGDKDCLDAIRENIIVIDRQKERVELLKQEVERRGGRWHGTSNSLEENRTTVGQANGPRSEATRRGSATNGNTSMSGRGGTLSDEELRRQMEARMTEAEEDDDGMHL